MDKKKNTEPLKLQPFVAKLADAWNVVAAMVVCSWLGFFIGEKKGDAATGALIGAFVGLTYVGCLIWLAVKRNSVK